MKVTNHHFMMQESSNSHRFYAILALRILKFLGRISLWMWLYKSCNLDDLLVKYMRETGSLNSYCSKSKSKKKTKLTVHTWTEVSLNGSTRVRSTDSESCHQWWSMGVTIIAADPLLSSQVWNNDEILCPIHKWL